MKKGHKFLLLIIGIAFLLSVLILIKNIPAQDEAIPGMPLGITPEKVDSAGNLIQNPEEGKEYLKQEWTKLLEASQFGRILLKISVLLTYFDFFWKPVLGLEYSLSWLFVFAISIWLILFFITSSIMDALLNKKLFGYIGGFCVASLVGLSGVIKYIVNLLSIIINNIWIAWLSLALAIMIMMLIIYLGGGLKSYLAKQKEQNEKEKTEKAQKIIQTQGKVAKKELESYK